ncbi:NACHT, LRR and PYD domains-containing protein 3-like isoform X1, partial [Astyanax mexicanus]
LPYCNLTHQSCDTLQTVLQSEKSALKELDLSNNDLQDKGVNKLSAGLKSSHCKLEILRSVLMLSLTKFRQAGYLIYSIQSYFTEDCVNCLVFTSLFCRLVMCKLSEQSCKTLQSVLQSGTCSLKELDLSNNDLQDSGVDKLSAGLKSSHCKLEILRLSGCLITENGCSSLASALSSNPSHLKELDLTYNNPGEPGVKQLSSEWSLLKKCVMMVCQSH